MEKSPNSDTDKVSAPRNESSSFVLLTSMADTTWRMFVPTLPLIMAGDCLDQLYGTKPWLLLAGAVVGGVIAAWLIRRQLRSKV